MDWLESHIPPWVFIAIVAHGTILLTVAYLIFLERKVAAWTQDRIGPNRVGPWGLLQSIADGLKMLVKEDYRPASADSRRNGPRIWGRTAPMSAVRKGSGGRESPG